MPVKPRLKVAFSDFWAEFDPENNFFSEVLRSRFQVEVSTTPDVVIASTFGNAWAQYSCPRIFFTGENIESDPRHFDASLSFARPSETNYYLPLYRLYASYPGLFVPRTITEDQWRRKKAVGVVFSNAACRFRTQSFLFLDKAVGVGSGGRAYNNVGGPVADKSQFLRDYRFGMAFENATWPGYTTEKLAEAYAFETIPLYWGDPLIQETFNPRSFLLVNDRTELPRLAEEITRLGQDFSEYRRRYEEPLFPDNREPGFLKVEPIADFLEQTVARGFRRQRRTAPSAYAVHQWHARWNYRDWPYGLRGWIPLFLAFSWPSFLFQSFKAAVKRWLRRS